MRVRMSNRSAELEREAPLESDSSFVPPGDSAEASGPWKPVARRETPNCLPAGVTFQPPAVRGPLLPAACAVPAHASGIASASARNRIGRERQRVIERGEPAQTTIDAVRPRYRASSRHPRRAVRRGQTPFRTVSPKGSDPFGDTGARYRHAPDGHRLRPGGRAVRDLPPPAAPRIAPPARRGDGRRRRGAARPRLRPLPQLRRALRAGMGARPDPRAETRLHRRLRAHAAPARDGPLDARDAVRDRGGHAAGVGDAALLRRRRLAHLPARLGALLALGRRRRRARRADAAGARARRPAGLSGHGVRRADPRRGAAGGPPEPGAARRCWRCSSSPA